ncbi:MAG: hypothetical protein AAGB05_08200 [Pseudomonadota bacterium]
MRPLLPVLACLVATPALTWEARFTDVCEIYHSSAAGEVLLRYDPDTALYSMAIRRPEPWPSEPVFAIRFGQTGLTISTTRHSLSDGGAALSVADTGFGNVFLGLETAGTATAFTASASATFDLDGAPEAVATFRSCLASPAV